MFLIWALGFHKHFEKGLEIDHNIKKYDINLRILHPN